MMRGLAAFLLETAFLQERVQMAALLAGDRIQVGSEDKRHSGVDTAKGNRLNKVSQHQAVRAYIPYMPEAPRDSNIRTAFHAKTCQTNFTIPMLSFITLWRNCGRNQVPTPLRVLCTRVCVSLSTSEKTERPSTPPSQEGY